MVMVSCRICWRQLCLRVSRVWLTRGEVVNLYYHRIAAIANSRLALAFSWLGAPHRERPIRRDRVILVGPVARSETHVLFRLFRLCGGAQHAAVNMRRSRRPVAVPSLSVFPRDGVFHPGQQHGPGDGENNGTKE